MPYGRILRKFLTDAEQCKSIVELNIAAGKARQELDALDESIVDKTSEIAEELGVVVPFHGEGEDQAATSA